MKRAAVLVSIVAGAQDKAQQMTPEQKAAMEAWAKASTPGEPHRKLAEGVGTWDAKVTSWERPGAPPNVSMGTCTEEAVLGGRFLRQNFHGAMMGQPFNGIGYTGYDNVKQKYVSTWMDDMGTMVMVSYGTMAPDGTLTMWSDVDDPITGKSAKMREVMRFPDKDHQLFEMFGPDPSGKEFKMLEIAYTRKK